MDSISTKAADKNFLRTIIVNEYELPEDLDTFQFAKALLANFASLDGELRDELSYTILAGGIIGKGKLTTEQLEYILFTVLDKEHLFFGIGEQWTDSVFIRSFSNLIVAAVLYTDTRTPAFSPDTIQLVKQALLSYAQREQDWRGYVEGKGWAHTLAHLADALDECAQSPSLETKDREDILLTVCELAKLPVPLYDEEDIRLATVAHHIIICKQVSDDFLAAWLENCFVDQSQDIRVRRSKTNARNFLRSLSFLLMASNIALSFAVEISNLLQRLDAIYVETGE